MPRQSSKRVSAGPNSQAIVAEIIAACEESIENNDFEAALKPLTTINRHEHDPKGGQFITLLGLRVAVYLGLGKLDQALKDAKAMLELDPKDARGYTHSAQIELARGNPYTALALLQDGLECAGYPEHSIKLLSDDLHETEAHIASSAVLSKPKDPMAELPTEVVGLIFSHLDYRQHIQMLCVSKPWNRVLLSLPPLVDTLAFPKASTKITPKMLEVALKRWKAPKTLNVADLTDPSMNALIHKLQRGRDLFDLERIQVQDNLFMAWTLSLRKFNLKAVSLDYQTAVSLDWISNVLLPQCPCLEVAHFDHVSEDDPSGLALRSKTLLELGLTFPVDRSLEFVVLDSTFYSGLPALEKLSCTGISFPKTQWTLDLRHMKHLRSLTFAEADLPNIFLPPSLETLDLSDCWFPDRDDPSPASGRAQSFTALDNLNSLNLSLDEYPEFVCQAAAKSQPGNLTICRASEDPYTSPGILRLLNHPWFRTVQVLRLRRTKLLDIHAATITTGCPRLRELYIEDPFLINGNFVSEIILCLYTTLKKMSLQAWDNPDFGFIPWAADHGVELKITPGDPLHPFFLSSLRR